MAIEQMFTSLPTVSNSLMTDIICAVQGYVSPSALGLSTQQTLSQVYSLFQSNIILFNSGNPNGSVAGTTYQFCWDSLNSTLYICTSSGTSTTAIWTRADINDGYTTTATAAATTTLTVLSTYWQFFTGSTTQTVVMPVASTLAAGMTWSIVNASSGAVTIQSSGLNTIATLSSGQTALVTCILNSGTTAASWSVTISHSSGGVISITGTANQVLVNGTSGSAEVGAITLTLPQNIATSSSPTFNNLQLNGSILGTLGNVVTGFLDAASAVNYVRLANAATGTGVGVSAQGSDSNISISLSARGTSPIGLVTGALTQPILIYSGTSSQHLTRFNMANTAADRSITFQDASGTLAFLSDLTGYVTSVSGTSNRITSTGGTTPVIDISASYVGQSSITTLGTVTTGVWNGTIVSPIYGGTGVNNAAKTITLGGSLITSGAFASTFTMTGITGVTFPTSGTLATLTDLAGAVLLTPSGTQTITVGGLTVNAGPFIGGTSAGSGTAGSIQLYNAAASAGNFQLFNSTVSTFTTRLTNASVGQFTTITFPDPGSGSASVAYTSTASGIVNSGSINQLAWYAANGTTVSGLATGNSGVLVTSAGGVPSISSTLPSGMAATNMNLTTPTLGVAAATSINFGGTALSIYTEGTFTPTFSCSSPGNLSVVYTNQSGVYTRIGRMVFFTLRLSCTPTFTTASGQVQFPGLPFACVGAGGVGCGGSQANITGSITWPAGATMMLSFVDNGVTYVSLGTFGSAVNSSSVQMSGLVSGTPYLICLTGAYNA